MVTILTGIRRKTCSRLSYAPESDASNLPVLRIIGVMMYYLRYNLVPVAGHPRREQLGEALMNCWIEGFSLAEADSIARHELRQQEGGKKGDAAHCC
jgi:hypothetical protein